MRIVCEEVPTRALPFLADQLREFGATVTFESERSGCFAHPSGKVRFDHDGFNLFLKVIENAGHFPKFMLIGGIRQFIEETLENLNQSKVRLVVRQESAA
jgi:hypothetical protein